MRSVAIIQARVGSTRLPGKVLLDLAGKTVLGRVVERVGRMQRVKDMVVATSSLETDDAIEDECRRLGVPCFRGSEDDVLDRFKGAADTMSAEQCVRITADCPLIDPGVSDDIIEQFEAADPPVDYASNKIPQSFPRGLDTEVFSRYALDLAAKWAKKPYHRTHVTAYMYQTPEIFTVLSVTSDVDRAGWRWTIDTPEDLAFVRSVYERMEGKPEFTWLDVVKLVESDPKLAAINANVVQKEIEEG
ncbi:MAG TPA: glycosyltransferase family protein [Gemmatimonadaceae bacterium]|nr:glycosyltransferase family protein [Gemmatimonadaceae bacterium]